MARNTLVHLRIPFSLFLLPVFLFALSQANNPDPAKSWWVFVLIHFFLYPASNGYNSYYDKDEGSIGLLENPPPVDKSLFYTAWAMDLLAIGFAIYIGLGLPFAAYLLIYGLVSKAYSHPLIRLKKRPVTSWLVVCFFQGFITYLASIQCIDTIPLEELVQVKYLVPALICSSNLLAVYPLTQVYQHEEDSRRGDVTYSRLVGIKGTFVNAALFFTASFAGFCYYFLNYGTLGNLITLTLCMGPVIGFFAYWWIQVQKDEQKANFRNTMVMNAIAALGLNLFFGILCF
jgi:4-hydroxybenzoate polyprenyltransferase